MSRFIDHIQEVVNAKTNAHDLKALTKSIAEENSINIPHVDLTIQFIGASGLPKMDVVGTADPYFVAKLDDKLTFVSTVKPDTLAPVWNEIWKIKNVPATADLNIQVLDKDNGAPHDDFIGKFKTSVSAGAKEAEIEGPVFRRSRGTFWLKIESSPAAEPEGLLYQFDGPIRYSRHYSPTVGLLTNASPSNANNIRLYSTWKMYIKGVPIFFDGKKQGWNKNYKAAQSIFGTGPGCLAVRSGIQAGHKMLYARSTYNGFGIIDSAEDVMHLLHGGGSDYRSGKSFRRTSQQRAPTSSSSTTTTTSTTTPDSSDTVPQSPGATPERWQQFAHRVKPAVYTYIISTEDDSLRFSETGAAFFVDFASKHALHANCAEAVYYSGEFHPRPVGGWDHFIDTIPDDQVGWELVIDNNSGTYSPDKAMLPQLQKLLEYNFKSYGVGIVALDREDEELVKSREACRSYALKNRGVGMDELQPHVHSEAGEVSLSHQAFSGPLNGASEEQWLT